jgi:hypothetical protein
MKIGHSLIMELIWNRQIKVIASLWLAVLVMISPTTLRAREKSLLQRISELKLPSATNKITVFYSPMYRKRAFKIRGTVEEMMKFYEDKFDLKVNLYLAVLTRPHWIQVVQNPYGIPGVTGSPPVVFMSATTSGAIYFSALRLEDKISKKTIHRINSCGFTFEEGASEFVDLIGLHELGHLYTRNFGIRPPKIWLNEFIATYFSYAFLRERHPKLANLWDAMATDAYIEGMTPKHKSLEDFERFYSGVGPDNYAWYQAMFNQRVAEVYAVKKLSFLEEVKAAFPEGLKESVSIETVINKLEQIVPGFIVWSKGFQKQKLF